MLIVGDEGEVLDTPEEEWADAKDGGAVGNGRSSVSLNSVVGINSPRTMKLRGEIGGEGVIVTVDPGATHNFILSTAVSKLHLVISETEEFSVTLGTGEIRKSSGICKEDDLYLGALIISENFLSLELGHVDVILGLEWLAKLGTIATNWKIPMMQFSWQGAAGS